MSVFTSLHHQRPLEDATYEDSGCSWAQIIHHKAQFVHRGLDMLFPRPWSPAPCARSDDIIFRGFCVKQLKVDMEEPGFY